MISSMPFIYCWTVCYGTNSQWCERFNKISDYLYYNRSTELNEMNSFNRFMLIFKIWPNVYVVVSALSYVCTGGATQPEPIDNVEGYPCPRGFYCPAGTTVPLGCDIGTYNNKVAQANCTICPAGSMCNQTNMTEPVECREGRSMNNLENNTLLANV